MFSLYVEMVKGAEMTQEIIGFLIIEYAVIGFITFVTGWDLELKDKLMIMFGFWFFITTLALGIGMLVDWS